MLTAGVLVALQLWGSYTLIRNLFRWLALALLAYIPAALLAKPDVWTVLTGTLLPRLQFNQEFLSLLVAVIGTTLSAYLYTWQSNEEVEEEIAMGRRRLSQRRGAMDAELTTSWWDIVFGMFFSNIIMYFIMLASTLFPVGQTDINTAAEAAQALQPFAGKAAGLLFALGVVGVGFLAVPIMVSGAAYDLCQVTSRHPTAHATARCAGTGASLRYPAGVGGESDLQRHGRAKDRRSAAAPWNRASELSAATRREASHSGRLCGLSSSP